MPSPRFLCIKPGEFSRRQVPMPEFEFNALVRLLLQMASIILVSRLIHMGLRRIGQPLVIAEVIRGFLSRPRLPSQSAY